MRKNKKLKIIIAVTILLIALIPVITIHNINKMEKLDQTTTNKTYKEPVNKNFKDDNLYNCIIDAYNTQNSTSLPYTTNLTDEQLLTITELECASKNIEEKKINDAQGIEKLTNLTSLSLSQHNITTIDVSKNTKLTSLGLIGDFGTVDLSNNVNLEELNLMGDNLTSVDLSNNVNLKEIMIVGTMNTIDLSKNTKLTLAFISSVNLNTIDVSKNTELTYLSLIGSNLSTIDLSNNTKLETLDLSGNYLTKIDLSKNTKLTTIDISNNKLTLGSVYLKKDESIKETRNIKLPSRFPISYEIENTEIANYEEGKITGLKTGNSKITATLNGVKESKASDAKDIKVSGNIYVYDYTSEVYDLSKDYIYTGTNDFDKSKITCINCTIETNNNKLIIKANDEVVKEYKLVKISSTTYDLNNSYIYTGTNNFDKSKITCTNCNIEISDNNLLIKINDQILDQYTLSKISSTTYDLSKDDIYLNQNETIDKSKITCTNCTIEVSNNKLIIKVNDEVVKEYTIKYNAPTYKKGDINHDGKVNVLDVGKLFSHVRGKSIIKDKSLLKECDLNNDGKVNILDVGKLFSFVRGKTKSL